MTYGSLDSDAFGYSSNTGLPTSYAASVNGVTKTGTITNNTNGTVQKVATVDNLNSSGTQTCTYTQPGKPESANRKPWHRAGVLRSGRSIRVRKPRHSSPKVRDTEAGLLSGQRVIIHSHFYGWPPSALKVLPRCCSRRRRKVGTSPRPKRALLRPRGAGMILMDAEQYPHLLDLSFRWTMPLTVRATQAEKQRKSRRCSPHPGLRTQ